MPRLGLSEVGEAEGLPRGGESRSKIFTLSMTFGEHRLRKLRTSEIRLRDLSPLGSSVGRGGFGGRFLARRGELLREEGRRKKEEGRG